MLRKTLQIALVASTLSQPSRADACSLIAPPVEQTNAEVASKGYVVSATLIQAFDPKRQQPEIFRADDIYIGDGEPRNFVIFHHKAEYDVQLGPDTPGKDCSAPRPYKEGERIERLVLVPADDHPDPASHGRWRISLFAYPWGQRLDALVTEATHTGRFRKRPTPTATGE